MQVLSIWLGKALPELRQSDPVLLTQVLPARHAAAYYTGYTYLQ
jgi:hypothetical protein